MKIPFLISLYDLTKRDALENPWMAFFAVTLNAEQQSKFQADTFLEKSGFLVALEGYKAKFGQQNEFDVCRHPTGGFELNQYLVGEINSLPFINEVVALKCFFAEQGFEVVGPDIWSDVKDVDRQVQDYFTKYGEMMS